MPNATAASLGRNYPCHCGSGKKYKLCCLRKDEAAEREEQTKAAAEATPPPPAEQSAEPDAARPRRPTDQPWKRRAQSYRPFQRFLMPPKRGGG